MKLGDYFKKYNIRFLKSLPGESKIKIDDIGIDIKKIFDKRFDDLKLLLNKKGINMIKFYIPELGSIPNDLKISAIDDFINKSKNNKTIEHLLNSSLKIIEDLNYYDLDWYKRDIEKILIKISEKDIQTVNNFLLKLQKINLDVYNSTLKIINKLNEHNKFLNNLIKSQMDTNNN